MAKQTLNTNYYNFIMSVQSKMAEYGDQIFCDSEYFEPHDKELKELILNWAELRSLLKFLIYDFNPLENNGEEVFIINDLEEYEFEKIKEEYMVRHNINIIPYVSMANYQPIIQTKVENVIIVQGSGLPSGNQSFQVLGTNGSNVVTWMNIDEFDTKFQDLS